MFKMWRMIIKLIGRKKKDLYEFAVADIVEPRQCP